MEIAGPWGAETGSGLWSVEDLVALWESCEQRAETAA